MDRDYWRSEPTKRLIEEARTKGCELCVALGERLEEADDELTSRQQEAEDRAISNDETISELHTQIEDLQGKLVDAEDIIEKLKETKK
jgi:phosphate uptake regulator